MKVLKQILFTAAVVIGLAFTVSAQSNDQKKPPPKPPQDTPKIVVPDQKKPPPTPNPPKDGKKPGFAFAERRREFSGTVV